MKIATNTSLINLVNPHQNAYSSINTLYHYLHDRNHCLSKASVSKAFCKLETCIWEKDFLLLLCFCLSGRNSPASNLSNETQYRNEGSIPGNHWENNRTDFVLFVLFYSFWGNEVGSCNSWCRMVSLGRQAASRPELRLPVQIVLSFLTCKPSFGSGLISTTIHYSHCISVVFKALSLRSLISRL